MRNLDEVRQVFAFERHANREQLATLDTVAEPGDRLLATAMHLLTAIENWLARIEGRPPGLRLDWHTPDRAELALALEVADASLARFAASLTEAQLAQRFEYRTSQGDPYSNMVGDVVLHLMLHSAEHRGQISWEIGRLGGKPVSSEYIGDLRPLPPARA